MATAMRLKKIQDLYLAGRKGEAMMAVPPELIDEVALVGPKERIRERLQPWLDSDITTLNITVFDENALRDHGGTGRIGN